MLHRFKMSVDYNRVLRVGTQVQTSVLKCMAQNEGVFLPPDILIGRHVFLVIDDVDFAQDTPDGKRTLHGTTMAIYQRRQPQDKHPDLNVDTTDRVAQSNIFRNQSQAS